MPPRKAKQVTSPDVFVLNEELHNEIQRESSLPIAPPIVALVSNHPLAGIDDTLSDNDLEYVDPPSVSLESVSDELVSIVHPFSAPLAPPPASSDRSLTKQTTASFISAGGAPYVPAKPSRSARSTRGRPKKAAAVPTVSSLTMVPASPGPAPLSASPEVLTRVEGLSTTVNSLDARCAALERTVADHGKDSKAIAVEHALVHEKISQLMTTSNLKRNPEYKALHNDHFETRTAMNRISNELSALIASTNALFKTVTSDVAQLVENAQANEKFGRDIPPIVPPPSAVHPPRSMMHPTRQNGFLSSPHPFPQKRKERDWDSRTVQRPGQHHVPLNSSPTDVVYGPVQEGDIHTRGMDVVKNTKINPDAVASIRQSHKSGYLIITFKDLDIAEEFMHMIDGNFGGKFRNCVAYVDGRPR